MYTADLSFIFGVKQVAYDENILWKLGSKEKIETYWNAALVHAQTRYCHPSLGTKIKLQRVGDFIYWKKKSLRADDSSLIKMYQQVRAHLKDEADLMVTLTHDIIKAGVGTIGIAYVQSVCASNIDEGHLKQSINEWQPTTAEFGSVSYTIQPCFF